jgi:uncharacterized protein YjiS (DUF1127 family)
MGAPVTLVKALLLIPNAVRAYANRGPVLRLLDMDDRMLRDIGLTRGDVTASLAGSLAQDPSTRLRILAVERRAGLRAQARERQAEFERMRVEEQIKLPLAKTKQPCDVQ